MENRDVKYLMLFVLCGPLAFLLMAGVINAVMGR